MTLSIRHRLYILVGVIAAGLCLLVAESARNIYSTALLETQANLKHGTENAYSIMAKYAEMAEAGEISPDQAKASAIQAINMMRHGEHGYYWIHDLNLKMVMHPIKPNLNGKDISEVEDKTGSKIFGEMNKVVDANNGSGFYRYYWGKTGASKSEAFPKESYVKLFKPWGYVVGTGVYIDDLNAKVWGQMWVFLGLAIFLLVGLVVMSQIIARSINGPLLSVQNSITALANGNTDIDVDATTMPSELAAIAKALNVFRDNAIERAKLEEAAAQARKQQEDRQHKIEGLIASFREQSQVALAAVSGETHALQSTASNLTRVASDTSQRATGVASASEQASSNVLTVASAAEQLSASIAEISRQVSDTTSVIGKARDSTISTNGKISSLADSAQQIGEVVNLIQDIAEQTNLLALNATIEAARAGEAGKGFSVVASEVKSLASQTARATGQIAAHINGIQSSTRDAVEGVRTINTMMEEVNSFATAIAASVEEQGSATYEISRSVEEAAAGTGEVAVNVTGVQEAVDDTKQSAGQVERSSNEVNKQVDNLRQTVDQFLNAVVAA